MKVRIIKTDKVYDDLFDLALTYYTALLTMNKRYLPTKLLHLIAAIAVYGTPSSPPSREKIMNRLGYTSKSVFYSSMTRLKKTKLIHRVDNKFRLIPALTMNFKENPTTILTMKLRYEPPTESTNPA